MGAEGPAGATPGLALSPKAAPPPVTQLHAGLALGHPHSGLCSWPSLFLTVSQWISGLVSW